MFSKPLSCLQPTESRDTFKLGPQNGPEDINFEVELGVVIGKTMDEPFNPIDLHDYIKGYYLLLDYTDKTFLMQDMKNAGPFFIGKCQDNLLVLSDFISKKKIPNCHQVHLELDVNGEMRQSDVTGNMHFKIDE